MMATCGRHCCRTYIYLYVQHIHCIRWGDDDARRGEGRGRVHRIQSRTLSLWHHHYLAAQPLVPHFFCVFCVCVFTGASPNIHIDIQMHSITKRDAALSFCLRWNLCERARRANRGRPGHRVISARALAHTHCNYVLYIWCFFSPCSFFCLFCFSCFLCAGIMQTYIRVGLALPDAMMASLVCERNAYMRVWLLCVCVGWMCGIFLCCSHCKLLYCTIRRRRPVRFHSHQRAQHVCICTWL